MGGGCFGDRAAGLARAKAEASGWVFVEAGRSRASTEAEPSRASWSTQSRRFGVGPRARSPGPLLVVQIKRLVPDRQCLKRAGLRSSLHLISAQRNPLILFVPISRRAKILIFASVKTYGSTQVV